MKFKSRKVFPVRVHMNIYLRFTKGRLRGDESPCRTLHFCSCFSRSLLFPLSYLSCLPPLKLGMSCPVTKPYLAAEKLASCSTKAIRLGPNTSPRVERHMFTAWPSGKVLTSRPLRHEERDWSKGGLQKPEGGRSNRLGNIQCTRQTSPMSQCVQEKARDFLFAVGPWDSLEAHGSLRRLYNIFDSSGCFKVCIDS